MISTTGDGSAASNAAVRWWQKFEGYDVQRFMKGTSSAKKFALSFWVKSATTGDYAVELLDYHNSNKGITRTYTVNVADTWEYKTIIFPADTSGTFNNDNTAAFACEFWLVAGSNYTSGGADAAWHAYSDGKRAGGHTANAGASNNDYVRITGVQLEAGDVATDFEHRSYGDELARCQRYYYLHAHGATSNNGAAAPVASTANYSSSLTFGIIQFPVTMRTYPTLTGTEGTSYFRAYAEGGSDPFDNMGLQQSSPQAYIIQLYGNLSVTQGQAAWVQTNNAATKVAFQAEL